jgi:hypothetical protein
MGKPGRKPLEVPTVRWECRIDALLASEVELILSDPLKKKPVYGARSELVEQLLRTWLNDRKAGFVEHKLTEAQVKFLLQANCADVTVSLATGLARMPVSVARMLGFIKPEGM